MELVVEVVVFADAVASDVLVEVEFLGGGEGDALGGGGDGGVVEDGEGGGGLVCVGFDGEHGGA